MTTSLVSSPAASPPIVSWVDVARYRSDAKKLGYGDVALDGLVVRWNALLGKAKRGAE